MVWVWLVLALGLMPLVPAQATSISIAAIVADDAITSTDVEDRLNLMMATSNIPPTVENQNKLRPRILQGLIDETLQLQEARRQSIIISDAEIAKAVDALSQANPQAKGDIRAYMASRGLSMPSLESQLRAQLAWGKVVQRKLRRNVSISQDEIVRAQQAKAAAPVVEEVRVAAIVVPLPSPEQAEQAGALAASMMKELRAGATLPELAAKYRGKVQLSAPSWMKIDDVPAVVATALRPLKPGEYTEPLRSTTAYQIVQLLERGNRQQQSDATEIIVKQLEVKLPAKQDKNTLPMLRSTAELLRSNPGNCEDLTLPKTPLLATAKFARVTLGKLGEPLRGVMEHLPVGQVSDPMFAPDAMRMVLLCERVEATAGGAGNSEEIRQQLFAEKLELEAQKYMRNLRRDTFIDIKGQ